MVAHNGAALSILWKDLDSQGAAERLLRQQVKRWRRFAFRVEAAG